MDTKPVTVLPARSDHLYEQIHEILWDKILRQEIVPKQRLKDSEWAKHLGVSRTPVREAMRKMQQEGILLALTQGGYEVRNPSEKDLKGLYSCRAALEALAAKEATPNTGKKDLRTLELILQRTDAALNSGDLDAIFELNTQFHKTIIDLSDNQHLKALCDTLRRLILFYRSALLNKVKDGSKDRSAYIQRLTKKNREHGDIVKAIADGDAVRASALMEQHTLSVANQMESEIQEE